MLLLIDNYDSFTWNLYHFLGEAIVAETGRAPDIRVVRNDEITVGQAIDLKPEAVVLSPGPCDPNSAGICLDVVSAMAPDTPILGVCLGHQAIGQAFGGDVIRAPSALHGKTSPVRHTGAGVFRDLPQPMTATRYHSLTIDPETFPACLEATATSDDGVIMGLRHRAYPTHGVQFHPESVATVEGRRLLRNFLVMAEILGEGPAHASAASAAQPAA